MEKTVNNSFNQLQSKQNKLTFQPRIIAESLYVVVKK